MSLNPFVAKKVNPGEPVTAQAWNDIVEALDAAYKYLLASGFTIKVKVGGAPQDRTRVRVTAEGADGALFEAVAPVEEGEFWMLSGLRAGTYKIRAEAAGYVTASDTAILNEAVDTEVSLTLAAAGPFMPDVFGLTLTQASSELAKRGIPILALWDFSGETLVPTNPGQIYTDLPIFAQSPAAGSPIPSNSGAKLVVAVPEQTKSTVEVPSLVGMTQVEVQKTLEKLGLAMGTIDVRSKPKAT